MKSFPDTTLSSDILIQVGTPSQVPVTTGLVLLLESDIKIGLGESNIVVSWLDGSGNGNNLHAEGDPRHVAGLTPTGQPAIVFDGAGDHLELGDHHAGIALLPSGNADRTMFFVVNYLDHEGVSAGLV